MERFRNILVGVDLSEADRSGSDKLAAPSEAAVPRARVAGDNPRPNNGRKTRRRYPRALSNSSLWLDRFRTLIRY